MISLLHRRMLRVLLVAVALIGGLLVTAVPVGADTVPSTTTTATPSGGSAVTYTTPGTAVSVFDGQSVAVHVARTGTANVFGIQARLCKGGANINNLFDFSPGQSGLCAPGPLDAGTDNAVPTSGLQPAGDAPANTFADVSFTIGAGTTNFSSFGLGFSDFTCGVGNPCELVIRQSTSDTLGDNYIHFNLNYTTAPGPPGAPGTPTASAGNTTAQVTWSAPSDDGGSPVTDYVVTPEISGVPQTAVDTGSTNLTFNVTGLTDFTAYTFTVHAVNAYGPGSESSQSNAVTPKPTAPTAVTGIPGNNQVTVSWTASSPAPTNYTVAGTPGGSCGPTSSTTCVVTGLTNGTPYTFVVTANYAGGTTVSTASAPVTPNGPTKPGRPHRRHRHARQPAGVAHLDGPEQHGQLGHHELHGDVVAGRADLHERHDRLHRHRSDQLHLATPSPSRPPTRAASRAIRARRRTRPSRCRRSRSSRRSTPGNGQVTVSWSASSPAPTNYTVNGTPGGTCTTATTSCVVSGLTNGTSYTFTVTANYGAGTVTSTASASVIPAGPPGSPTAVAATAGNGQATVSWTAPADNGGARHHRLHRDVLARRAHLHHRHHHLHGDGPDQLHRLHVHRHGDERIDPDQRAELAVERGDAAAVQAGHHDRHARQRRR